MQLVIDIGNTNVVFGIYNEQKLVNQWREETSLTRPSTDYALGLRSQLMEINVKVSEIHQVVLSSVVPSLTVVFEEMLPNILKAHLVVVGKGIYDRLSIEVTKKEEIGTDLVANAVAGYHKYPEGCIVVDFGTALTFTSINEKGKILGVAIAPGLKTAMNALVGKTAKLPEIPLEIPTSAIGTDTKTAMQSGILLGYVGLVTHLLQETKKEIGKNVSVLATGGLSSILTPLQPHFHQIEPNLTLKGLHLIGETLSVSE